MAHRGLRREQIEPTPQIPSKSDSKSRSTSLHDVFVADISVIRSRWDGQDCYYTSACTRTGHQDLGMAECDGGELHAARRFWQVKPYFFARRTLIMCHRRSWWRPLRICRAQPEVSNIPRACCQLSLCVRSSAGILAISVFPIFIYYHGASPGTAIFTKTARSPRRPPKLTASAHTTSFPFRRRGFCDWFFVSGISDCHHC